MVKKALASPLVGILPNQNFGARRVKEEMAEYCVPTIAETINQLGGVEEGKVLPGKIDLYESGGLQEGLFDKP